MVISALQYLNISLKLIRYSDVCNVNVVKKLRYERFVREHLSIRTFVFRNTINLSNPSNSNLRVKKGISSIHLHPKTKRISPAGNRTPVSRVTGGDTHHYTTEELDALNLSLMVSVMGKRPLSL